MFETEKNKVTQVIKFLQNLDTNVKYFGDLARFEEGWIYLPASVTISGNAFSRADLLQKLEDKWNDQVPEPSQMILLVPTYTNNTKEKQNGIL